MNYTSLPIAELARPFTENAVEALRCGDIDVAERVLNRLNVVLQIRELKIT